MVNRSLRYLALAAGAYGMSPAATAAPATAPAGIALYGDGASFRLRIGALDAYVLDDGTIDTPNDGSSFGIGHSTAEVGDLLAAAGRPRDHVVIDITALVVIDRTARGAKRPPVWLFDTGGAAAPFAKAGRLPRSLAYANVRPGDVTDIFITHHHLDHTGGLVAANGALAFPNAAIHMSAPEWTAMQADPDAKRIAAAIAAKVVPFQPGAQLSPEVTAVATQGHTPGHSSYAITSRGERLFVLGDVAHHSIISVQQPTWPIDFDEDRAAAEAMRVQTLGALADANTLVFAGHFPYPGLGHFHRRGDAFVWQPE